MRGVLPAAEWSCCSAGQAREAESGRSECRRRRRSLLWRLRRGSEEGERRRRPRDGGDSEAGDPLGLRGGRDSVGAVGLPRLESGAQPETALHRRRRRALRCAGTLGSNHTCDVCARLLEDLVERLEVLPLRWYSLLCPLYCGILHIPGIGHHTTPVPARSEELLPVVRLDLHLLQVGLSPQLILTSVQK